MSCSGTGVPTLLYTINIRGYPPRRVPGRTFANCHICHRHCNLESPGWLGKKGSVRIYGTKWVHGRSRLRSNDSKFVL